MAACTSAPTLPPKRDVITEFKVERVEVPVRVACVAVADIPARPQPTPIDIKVADTRQLAAAVVADALALQSYAQRAEIVLMQCAAAAPAPK